jgi:hypothetical protein
MRYLLLVIILAVWSLLCAAAGVYASGGIIDAAIVWGGAIIIGVLFSRYGPRS